MNTLKEFELAVADTGEWRIDTVNGRSHYVTVNRNGRAMVGPQARRRRGWRWPTLKRKPKIADNQDALRNLYHDGEALNPSLARVVEAETSILDHVPRIRLNMTLPTPPPPQEKPHRLREWWQDRFYCKEWHEAMRHLSLDVILGSVALLTFVAVVKGALWLISL